MKMHRLFGFVSLIAAVLALAASLAPSSASALENIWGRTTAQGRVELSRATFTVPVTIMSFFNEGESFCIWSSPTPRGMMSNTGLCAKRSDPDTGSALIGVTLPPATYGAIVKRGHADGLVNVVITVQ